MTFPAIEALIPHRTPMRLVDEVVHQEGRSVTCRTTIGATMPFVRDGEVPMMVALELFAQSACTLVSLLALRTGGPIAGGAVLGTRKLELHGASLAVGDVVHIHCEERMAMGPMAQIHCRLLRGEELLAEGSINVMAGTPPAGEHA